MNRSHWPWLIHPQIPCRPSFEALARSRARRPAWPGVAAKVVEDLTHRNGRSMGM